MGFWEVTVVWEGAVDTQETFLDSNEDLVDVMIEAVQADAVDTQDLVEVFTLYHDHELTLECECVQFVTDHRPSWTNEK